MKKEGSAISAELALAADPAVAGRAADPGEFVMAACEPRRMSGRADCTETPVSAAMFARPDSIMVR